MTAIRQVFVTLPQDAHIRTERALDTYVRVEFGGFFISKLI